ncbi:MAG: hypothetical protein J2P25_02605 [Nocardiopsaceae bacterium]|nr:hypothetical protein [Nocardiopsaceae bacterium]
MSMGRLYGRGKVIDFVEAALKYDRPLTRPMPILLLVGPRGSGGSALLAGLWEEFGYDAPCARLDLADAEEVADVMLTAMQGLLRHVWGVRQLRFPRLRLAVKALSFDDDGHGRVAFDRYMRAGERTAKTRSTLQDWVDRVSRLLLRSPEQQLIVTIVARLLGWTLLSGIDRHRDRIILRWFTEESDVAGGSGFDPLWRLYRWQHENDEDKRYRADKTLCDAFLTDMRTDYNDVGIWHDRRTRNPALYLDNTDSRIGRRLLGLLEECRRKGGDLDGKPADPLLVAAVQHRPPSPEAGTPIRVTKDETEEEKLSFTEWRRTVNAAGPLILWYPVYLSALDDSDVTTMVSSRRLGIGDGMHRDADFVRELASAHPEATARLASLLHKLSPSADPRLLLDQRIPPVLRDEWQAHRASTTVGDYLLKQAFADDLRMLPDGSIDADGNAMLDAMAVVAATPGFRLGASQAALNFLEWNAVTAVAARDRLTQTLWLARPGETMWLAEPEWRAEHDDDEPRLHPLAALLLRHWLARSPDKWTGAHEGYVVHYSDPDEAALRHHHKLALVVPDARWTGAMPGAREAGIEPSRMDQLTDVITFLDQERECGPDREQGPGRDRDRESGDSHTRDWLDVLDTVVAAPNRLRTTHHPEVFVRALAGPEEPGNRRQVIARLAVARWLFNDKLFDPTCQLKRLIADEYQHLAQLPGSDGDLLLEEEAKYREIQPDWGN